MPHETVWPDAIQYDASARKLTLNGDAGDDVLNLGIYDFADGGIGKNVINYAKSRRGGGK